MKPRFTLSQLRTLATAAVGDATLGAELRAQVLAHPLEYAEAIGISSRDLVRGFESVQDDDRLGAALLVSLKQIGEKRREATRAIREEEGVKAADEVRSTVEFHGDVLALNVDALAIAARGVDFVQFVDPDDNAITVSASMLRDILALREDAVAIVSVDGLEVQWGTRGRIRFRDVGKPSASETVRALFLPHIYQSTRARVLRFIAPGSRAIYRRTGGIVNVWQYDSAQKAYRCLTEHLGVERFIPYRELDVVDDPANDAAAE